MGNALRTEALAGPFPEWLWRKEMAKGEAGKRQKKLAFSVGSVTLLRYTDFAAAN